MNKEFSINIIFLISINLLIKPFFIFGIDRSVQNIVGIETYGIYFTLLSLTYLFGIINDFGIQNFNNRAISQNHNLLQQYFPNILAIKILLGGLYLGVVFLMAWIWKYDIEVWHILLMLSINMILAQYIYYLRSNISGLGMYRTDSMISAMDKLLMILICGALLWLPVFSGKFQIEWFVYAQTVSFLLTALLSFFVVKNKMPNASFSIDFRLIFSLLKKSAPYALVIFLMSIYTRIDAVMIERLVTNGRAESGIYGAAYRLLDASNMIGFLFAGLLLPMFAKMIKDKISVLPLVRMSALMIWSGAITLSVITYFFQKEIVHLLYVEATPYWGEVLGVLMISFVAVSGTYIFGTLLTANGSLKKMNFVLVIAVILNIIFNYILIPKYGALGAAWTTVGTQFFAMFAQLFLAKKEFGWKYNFNDALRLTVFSSGLIGLTYGCYEYLEMGWGIRLGISLLGGVGLALLFRLLDLKLAFDFLKNKF
ncbi:MAG TPA: polysaccharide biosynthesis protein [Phaeodactylibacter sp.]|nr:polysaccharide biosynthesis protein [Phaeodactylibacter sp.]